MSPLPRLFPGFTAPCPTDQRETGSLLKGSPSSLQTLQGINAISGGSKASRLEVIKMQLFLDGFTFLILSFLICKMGAFLVQARRPGVCVGLTERQAGLRKHREQ